MSGKTVGLFLVTLRYQKREPLAFEGMLFFHRYLGAAPIKPVAGKLN